MTTEGLLFRFEVGWGKEDDAARFLEEQLGPGLERLPIIGWSALRFDLRTFGVVATFPADDGLVARVADGIAALLRERGLIAGPTLLEDFQVISPVA